MHKLVRDRDNEDDDVFEADSILHNILLLPITTESSSKNLDVVQSEVIDFVNKLNRELSIPPTRILAKI